MGAEPHNPEDDTVLAPFTNRCPKCGAFGNELTLLWQEEEPEDRAGFAGHQITAHPERLDVACTRCEYHWFALPLDHEPAS